MIVTEEKIEERIKSPTNIIHRGYGKAQKPRPNQPEFLREIEADLYIKGESQRSIANAFGISQSTVSHAATGISLSDAGKSKLANRKEQIKEAAMDKLLDSIGLLGEDKLKGAKAVELSQIAGNMAKVVEKMEGKQVSQNNVLVIVAPRQKTEDEYETVTL